MANFKKNQQVKFRINPTNEPMYVVWSDGERTMVLTDIGWGNLNPTSIVKTDDLESEPKMRRRILIGQDPNNLGGTGHGDDSYSDAEW